MSVVSVSVKGVKGVAEEEERDGACEGGLCKNQNVHHSQQLNANTHGFFVIGIRIGIVQYYYYYFAFYFILYLLK